MFKKIVSSLPFSPSLVGKIGQYYKMLDKEARLRKLGVIILGLTIILQLILIYQPEYINSSKNNYISNNINYTDGLNRSISSINTSKGYIDSQSATANSGDQLAFTLTIENTSNNTISTDFSINLIDVLEYSAIYDDGGGSFNSNGYLSWGKIEIEPNSKQTRVFTIKILDEIPTNPTDKNQLESYDSTMSAKFGSNVSINIERPLIKTIENLLLKLPKTNPILGLMTMMIIILIIATLIYYRTKLLKLEIQLIRKDIGTGTIINYEEKEM